jgi:D-glycero-D-manno-heptose 1,7-bisphosphate phosphatase
VRFEAVYLDRDGVLNVELFDYVTRPEELVIIDGAGQAVRRLNEAGLTVAVVTNQSGIGKGRYTAAGLDAVHARLVAELAADGARLDGLYHCPHIAEDQCDCRKPLPGLLRRAADDLGFDPARAVLVGDTARDLQAAAAGGAAQILVRTGKGADLEARLPCDEVRPEVVVDDLAAAVDWILGQ